MTKEERFRRRARLDTRITVCKSCLRASCWQGELMCADSQWVGATEISLGEARELRREHPDYWGRTWERTRR